MAAKRNSRSRRVSRTDDAGSGPSGEFPASSAVKTALIRGNSFAAKAVQYVELDGLAIFEGDIVLGTAEEMDRTSEMLRAEMSGTVASSVMISGPQFRWPNCRVPFTIDPALPNQARVTDAIAHWHANTGFRFVARTTEPDFVTFRPASDCSSSVGRRGGQQFVNLGPGCTTGNTIHEIGHTIGLWHEQSRQDRDVFVTINWAKISPGLEHNFNQHITDGDDVGAYDFGSIMHYPRNAFSIDGTDTIIPIGAVPAGTVIGQRTGLSPGDIAAANTLCPPPPVTIKEAGKDVRETVKELTKDIRSDTVKEQILDTRKEMILDTAKEQIRDTVKEGAFDPGTTLAEGVGLPGRIPVSLPGLGGLVAGGLQPFAVATSPQSAPSGGGAAGLGDSIAQLDAQLQQLAEQLTQVDAAKQTLQAQFDETAALLAQLIQEHDQSSK